MSSKGGISSSSSSMKACIAPVISTYNWNSCVSRLGRLETVIYITCELRVAKLSTIISKSNVCGMGFPSAIKIFVKCMGIPPMAKLFVDLVSLTSW